jgi:hypothetical protein
MRAFRREGTDHSVSAVLLINPFQHPHPREGEGDDAVTSLGSILRENDCADRPGSALNLPAADAILHHHTIAP